MKMGAAFLVGAMLAFDMGGPINKTAWFFCFSLLEKHIYDWYAIVGVVALMPPSRRVSLRILRRSCLPSRRKPPPAAQLW
ncbi:PTS system fructose-specific IIC component [Salmonella enterica subsp. arizonae]|uniref:PTS system fructose-specific IIC component n=1 Tax=Salmonella enterica subsp. arizonae TaxID=59203 RepID=A0A447RBM8_SALER|nr:PTS system fructose-specific IIC component [Salmonella enterica subsp. arizonae]